VGEEHDRQEAGTGYGGWDREIDAEDGKKRSPGAIYFGRLIFDCALCLYTICCVVVIMRTQSIFGPGFAIGLSLILLLPLGVAIRMRRRWPAVRKTEFVFLFALLVFAIGGTTGGICRWYEVGMDHRYTEELQWARLGRSMKKDPAFQCLEIHVSPKHTYWVSGTVASADDLECLNSLALKQA
jgi:hypothetical protein